MKKAYAHTQTRVVKLRMLLEHAVLFLLKEDALV